MLGAGANEAAHGLDTDFRRTQMRAMACIIDDDHFAVGDQTVDKLSHRQWRDDIVTALKDERRQPALCQISTLVRQK